MRGKCNVGLVADVVGSEDCASKSVGEGREGSGSRSLKRVGKCLDRIGRPEVPAVWFIPSEFDVDTVSGNSDPV